MPSHSYTDAELRRAVRACSSMAATLRELGLQPAGGNYKTLRRRLKEIGANTDHFTGRAHLRGKTHNWSRKRSLVEILVEDSPVRSSSQLKARLLRARVLRNQCSEPGCMFHSGDLSYLGKPVTLHLDHINGLNTDNRIENLRLLCPLCHSQTPTYTGKNWGRYSIYQGGSRTCVDCGKAIARTTRCRECRQALVRSRRKTNNCRDCQTTISNGATTCRPCYARSMERAMWPTRDELSRRVAETSYSAVARILGVSDVAVRKRLLGKNT